MTNIKRGGKYRNNNSWIKKNNSNNDAIPIELTNIRTENLQKTVPQEISVANKRKYKEVSKISPYIPYELNIPKQINFPHKSSIVVSHSPSSQMTRDYQIPSRHVSHVSTRDSFSSEEIEPHVGVINNNFHFKNVPLAYKNVGPYVANTYSGTTFEPQTRQSVNGNYSYTPDQLGPNSQNKYKNSMKKRVKNFFAGPSRIAQQPKQTRKAMRKTRKMRK